MITRQPTASKRKGGTKIDAAHGLAAVSGFTASVVTRDEPASLARFEVICGPQRWVTGGGEYAQGGANRERTSGCVCSENAVVVRRRPSDRAKNGYLHLVRRVMPKKKVSRNFKKQFNDLTTTNEKKQIASFFVKNPIEKKKAF